MKPPRFWYRRPGIAARSLAPLGALYAIGTARRIAKADPWRAPVPVISVGNVNAGGTGKTPVVCWLMERLTARGRTPHVVTRGYGGTVEGPHRVSDRDSAGDVGDEALLLAAFGPVWVSRDRVAGARAAIEAGADCIVLDDAHQNPGLRKDLSIIVVDAKIGFGNGFCIPAGPLREPVSRALSRAGHVVLLRGDEAVADADLPDFGPIPVHEARLLPLMTGMPWNGLRVVAFAGIGRPEKFFATLRSVGARIVAAHPFDDHQPYSRAVLDRLMKEAKAARAQLVATEKDAVRLPPAMRREVLTLPVRVHFDDATALDAALEGLATGEPGS
ncbi:MAG: tetraacyldisaccharide 4'-kinase [Rubricella sp.]